MQAILISILVIAVTVVAINLFMIWVTQATTDVSLTARFRDAEFILNERRPPDAWRTRRPLFSRLMQGELFRRRPAAAGSDAAVLERLDGLIRYFEGCPFFETEEAKALMLLELRGVRARWVDGAASGGAVDV